MVPRSRHSGFMPESKKCSIRDHRLNKSLDHNRNFRAGSVAFGIKNTVGFTADNACLIEGFL
jgi:hypothetical protein